MSYKFFYTNMGVIGGISQAVEPTDAELESQKSTFSIFHFRPLLLVSTKNLYTSAYIYNHLAWGVELRELQQFEIVDSSIYGKCGCAKSWEKDNNNCEQESGKGGNEERHTLCSQQGRIWMRLRIE
jgi:hypothetical protein